MNLLKSTQQKDLPLWLCRHAEPQLLTHVVSLINRRAAAGATTRFVKVQRSGTRPGPWTLIRRQCTSREHTCRLGFQLRDHLAQAAARQGVALMGNEMKRKAGSVTPAHVPW